MFFVDFSVKTYLQAMNSRTMETISITIMGKIILRNEIGSCEQSVTLTVPEECIYLWSDPLKNM